MKLIGGPLANDRHRRARTASGGYLGTAVATGAIGAAVTLWQVGALRAIAWFVPWFAISRTRCITGFPQPGRNAREGVRARKGGRQPWRGRGSTTGGRPGHLDRYSTDAVSGSGPGLFAAARDHRGRARIPAYQAQPAGSPRRVDSSCERCATPEWSARYCR